MFGKDKAAEPDVLVADPVPQRLAFNGFAKNEFATMVGRNFIQIAPGVFRRRKHR